MQKEALKDERSQLVPISKYNSIESSTESSWGNPSEPSWMKSREANGTQPSYISKEITPIIKPRSERSGCCHCDPILFYFVCIQIISGCLAAFNLGTNAFVIYKSIKVSGDITKEDIVRGYLIAFCVCIIIVEMNMRSFINLVLIIDNWFVRGILYFFVGVLSINKDGPWNLFIEDISGCLLSMGGAIYILMSITCMQRVKNNRINEVYGKDIQVTSV